MRSALAAARAGDRWNLYHPPGAGSADDLDQALRRVIARFEEGCAAHGRGQVGRSILFDYAPGLELTSKRQLGELVLRAEFGFDECIADGWLIRAGHGCPIEELLAFVAEDHPTLKTA